MTTTRKRPPQCNSLTGKQWLRNSISVWSGIAKTQTDGNWKAAVINDVRTRLAEKSIRIHPRCEKLRAHCRYAVWKDPGRMLERMDGFGHFDGVGPTVVTDDPHRAANADRIVTSTIAQVAGSGWCGGWGRAEAITTGCWRR